MCGAKNLSESISQNILEIIIRLIKKVIGKKFKTITDNGEVDCTVVEKPFYDPKKQITSMSL